MLRGEQESQFVAKLNADKTDTVKATCTWGEVLA